ncbi:MAG: LPD28 domain-containing protein [Anaerorhabdus sp.]|uniref:LPD28 domain-containing protein n=1 Tax=Anaerorhabdus sp. TaxID=1872524 RepID=UPI002FC7D561
MGQYYNAFDETYEEILLFGQPVLFNPMRIAYDTLPKGMYRYEIRDDGAGNMYQLGPRILVNHWGTILSNKPIKLDRDFFRDIDENVDVDRLDGNSITIQEYLEKYPIKQKTKEHER